ncbi:MAG: Rieske 2Fe-2S domain-containing protein [Actinomycetota bacterium]|nr:Rieske 2Fe-2S domain-containing protein [Actinomycetota bacterium]
MSLRLAKRIAGAVKPLDPASNAIQERVRSAVANAPDGVRNALDGTLLGVPLHPALTDVPIGSWTAAVALDAVESAAPSPALRNAADGALAVGVLGALPAAVTGLADWRDLQGTSRRVGTAHAILNTTGLALNVTSLALRTAGRRNPARALSGIAFLTSTFAAHLGGQLSFGLGIRVNRTAWETPRRDFTPVLDEEELVGTELRRVDVGGVGVLITRSESGELCALSSTCTHLGGPLADGSREGDTVVCPWHGSRFDLRSGDVVGGPAVFPQPRYEARVNAGTIEVRPAER